MNVRLSTASILFALMSIPATMAQDVSEDNAFAIGKDTGVCEAFGTGYTRVPGTDTCIRVSGYVWSQVGANNQEDGWQNSNRARLQFDTRTDTEWGELAGRIRLQGTIGNE